MKRIFLVRHAKSSWADWSIDDHDRPLNPRGKRDAPFMADWLHTRYPEIDLFMSSTAKRARRTAYKFAKAYGLKKSDVQLEAQLYLCGEEVLLHFIRSIDNDNQSVAIFGHNPTWTYFINRFPDTRIDNVPTCGIGVIQADIEQWNNFSETESQVIAFYYPKQFQ